MEPNILELIVAHWKYSRNMRIALALWIHWLKHCPVHRKVVSSIPSQGTYRGCGSIPSWGTYKSQPIVFLSTLMSLSPPPSLFQINKKEIFE